MPPSSKPLAGVKVVDLTVLLPGPMCTLHLADMGADVIKVENPGAWDPVRGLPGSQFSNQFLMLNRNKRAITVNLRAADGQDILRRLVKAADVLVEGFRPGVADKLGVGYAAMSALNPRLVYCSISGYGQTGAMAQAGGHDINYECLAGVLEQTGVADGDPAPGGFPSADLTGGTLSAAMGILAALFDAQRSGRGRHVDVAMADCLMAHNIPAASSLQDRRSMPARGTDYLSGGMACYGVYATADHRHLAVGAIEIKFWNNFCETIGRPDLLKRGHLIGNEGVAARAEVARTIAAHDLGHWAALFKDVDACVTPVLRLDEANAHPHARSRGMVVETEHPMHGPYWQYAFPVKMTDFEFEVERQGASPGQDNDAVLSELDYAMAEIDGLRASGVI
ncbi:MAG: CoA transferase [Rhodocyclaceae bacterium]|nr:CoA transferase [Rhodocyclaceae bacterium]